MSRGTLTGITLYPLRHLAILSVTSVVSSIGGWGLLNPQSRDGKTSARSSLPFLLLFVALCVGCLFCLKIICGRCVGGRDEEEDETRHAGQQQQQQLQQEEWGDQQRHQQLALNGRPADIPTVCGAVPPYNAGGVQFLPQRGQVYADQANFGAFAGEIRSDGCWMLTELN